MQGPEEGSLQSSRIQQRRSSPYQLRSRGDVTRKAGSQPSGRSVQAQRGPVWSRREPFSRPQALTLSIIMDSPDNKVTRSLKRV
ncbi:UNVERIFIED_CONTAM: hypothetical protein NCL1_33693 [Trichonephila clavipes]